MLNKQEIIRGVKKAEWAIVAFVLTLPAHAASLSKTKSTLETFYDTGLPLVKPIAVTALLGLFGALILKRIEMVTFLRVGAGLLGVMGAEEIVNLFNLVG